MGKAVKYKSKASGVVNVYHPAYGSLSVNLADAEQWELKALFDVGCGLVSKVSNGKKATTKPDQQDDFSSDTQAPQPPSTNEGTEQGG